jgi:cytochrome c-type biogenesis protein CcmE
MSSKCARYLKFGSVAILILLSLAYLGYTGVQESKSYYVTIRELDRMGSRAYSKRLRIAGNVVPGSIKRSGTHVEFLLKEGGLSLPVSYSGTEAPPDTFKEDSQALADGTFGDDGIFHAKQLQAKCASKYAPQQTQLGATPATKPAKWSKTTLEKTRTGKDLARDSGFLGWPRARASRETKASDVANR